MSLAGTMPAIPSSLAPSSPTPAGRRPSPAGPQAKPVPSAALSGSWYRAGSWRRPTDCCRLGSWWLRAPRVKARAGGGSGRAVTAASRADAGPDRPPAELQPQLPPGGMSRWKVAARKQAGVREATTGDGCRSDGGDGGGCSSPARCSSRPHPQTPAPASLGRAAATTAAAAAAAPQCGPRPRRPTTFTTSTLRYRPLPLIGQL